MLLLKNITDIIGGVRTAIQIREDLGAFDFSKDDRQVMDNLNRSLRDNFLSSVFAVDNLKLKRITFEHSSGNVLEKVARGESVHRVRSLSELKRRLHGKYLHVSQISLQFMYIYLINNLKYSSILLDTYI